MTKHAGVKIGHIYALVDPREPDDFRYIGKTVLGPRVRLNQHLLRARKTCTTHRDSWIRGLVADEIKPQLEILASGEWTNIELAEQERLYIAESKAAGHRLTNHTVGGDGGAWTRPEGYVSPLKGVPLTPEHRAAVSASQLGSKRSEEAKINMREAQRRLRERDPEVDARRGLAQRGMTKTPEQRAAISATLKARERTPEETAANSERARQIFSGRKQSPEHVAARIASRRANAEARGRVF